MVSNFKSMIEGMARTKGISLTSGQEGRLRDWERDLDGGKIKVADVVSRLRGEFKYNFSSEDYRRIEKELTWNMK